MNRVYCFGFSSPEGEAILENRRAKVELYEQIRREYEHGGGTIRAVARKLGVHRREVRKALASAMPPERKIPERERPKTGGGDSIYRGGSGGRPQGAQKAAAHGAPHLDATAPRDA